MADQGYQTFDQVAEKVLAHDPPLAGVPKGRGLAAYLAKLNKGDDGWFRKHPRVAYALAELLELDVDDLLPPAAKDQKQWRFQEFPHLPPLNLEREEPCSLATLSGRDDDWIAGRGENPPNWLALASRVITTEQERPRAHWISAPPGSGKRLLARWVHARGNAVCLEVGTLREAVGSALPGGHGQWLIVVVAAADVASDRDALRALVQLGSITVLAPFEYPARGPTVNANQPGGFKQAHNEAAKDGWRLSTLRMVSDWRSRLMIWVGKRIAGAGSSLFDASQMQKWLQAVDSAEVSMPTPGDVLPLCALAHQHGAPWFNRQTAEQISARLVDNLVDQLPEELDGRLWLTASAGAVLSRLAEGRLSDLGNPVRGGSPAPVWAGYLPDSVLPGRLSEKEINAELASLRRLKAPKRQQAEAALARRMSMPNPLEAVTLLRRAGVLRTDRTGGLAVFPRLSHEAALRTAASDGVRALAPKEWGRWSIEPERRQLLDDALDLLAAPELLTTTRAVLANYSGCQLGCVGAVESLFAAMGRRLCSGWRPEDDAIHGLLQALWRQAESNRAARNNQPGTLRFPTTRVDGYWDPTEDFIANCWAWSIYSPRPESLHDADPPWLWPGWKQASLEELCGVSFSHKSPSISGNRSSDSPSIDRMFFMVDQLASRWEETKLPKKIPDLLALHVIVKAGEDKWDMDTICDVRWQRWHSWLLARCSSQLSPDVRQRIANWHLARLLKRAGDHSGRDLSHLQQSDESLYRFLLENSDWQEASKQLVQHSTDVLVRELPGLPEPLQELAIQHLIKRPDLDPGSLILRAHHDYPPLSAALLGRLLMEITKVRDEYGWDVARSMYEVDVAEALKVAEQSWRRAPHSQQTMWWFVEAPNSMLIRAPLIELLAKQPPDQRPWWARSFLSAMLHYAGERADELFRLLHGIS